MNKQFILTNSYICKYEYFLYNFSIETLEQLCLYSCSHIAVFLCKINSFKAQNINALNKLTLWERKVSI